MWPLIRKDLVRRWRSPTATLVMIAFPLFMSGALGSLYGRGGDVLPVIRVLVENRDPGGFLAEALIGALGQEQGRKYLDVVLVGAEGRDLIAAGKASALVVLPEGFTRDVLQHAPTVIEIVRNPAEGIKPEIVVQGGRLVATYLDQGGRLLGTELGAVQDLIEADEVPPAAKVGALAARITERLAAAESVLFPPLVRIGSGKERDPAGEDAPAGGGVFGYILVMTTVMALLFVATRSLGDLFEERNSGMLRRQLATPLPVWRIVLAKYLFSVVLGVIVMAILMGTGLALDWLQPPAAPGAVLLLGVVFNLAACGLLALITSLAGTEKQAGIGSWLVVMGMSALGGSMVPLAQLPAAMRSLAPFTLNYWAIEGFEGLLFDGLGLVGVAGPLLALLAAGLATSLAANALLVRRFRRWGS